MQLKLFQLNMFQGKFFDRIVKFVKDNNVDILHFQEVTGGKLSKGGMYRYPKELGNRNLESDSKFIGINFFEQIKNDLEMSGELITATTLLHDPESFIGNATFFNSKLKLIKKDVIWLKDFFEIEDSFTDIANISRAALICEFEADSKTFVTINTHLAWGPNGGDEQYKIEQAKKLYNKIERFTGPFVISGDFNVVPETQTASMFDSLGQNLTRKYKIPNTLNPKIHPAKQLFPPGLAVDYIFASPQIEIKKFRLVDEVDLSDHYGLLLEFEI